MNVKIIVLATELKTSIGVFYKGACVEITDSKKIQKLALTGEIEYCNPSQTGLFD